MFMHFSKSLFSKFNRFLLAASTIVLASCNLFNPIESTRLDHSDPEALTYEGYVLFRKGEYSESRRYFEKAIAVDSTHSEAWYGLAKAAINQQHVNIFELIRSVSADSNNDKINSMNDAKAKLYNNSIDSVMVILDKFTELEKQKKTDGKITTKTFSADYTILRFAKTALELKTVKSSLNDLFSVNKNGEIQLSLDVLNTLSNKDALVENLSYLGTSIQNESVVSTTVLKTVFPELADQSDKEIEEIANKFSNMLDSLEPDENGNYRSEDIQDLINESNEAKAGASENAEEE